MDRYLFAMITISLTLAGGTYLLCRLTKNRLVKYIPSFALGTAAGYLMYLISMSRRGFQTLALGLLVVLLFVGILSNLLTGISLDLILPFLRNRKRQGHH